MFVYSLSDPTTGELRYVGKTKGPLEERLRGHVSSRNRLNTHCAHWIRSIRSKEFKPIIEEIEKCHSMEALDEAERFYIEYFRSLGFRLTNIRAGGAVDNYPRSKNPHMSLIVEEQRNALSILNGGIFIQDDLGNIYRSKKEAAKKLGISRWSITRVLNGVCRHANGRTFSYLGEPVAKPFKWDKEVSNSKQIEGLAIVDQNGIVYSSIKDASNKIGAKPSNICLVLRGKRKHTHGYSFRYLEDPSNPLAINSQSQSLLQEQE
jgi:hypothetical protein